MATSQGRFSDKKYLNWLKGSLSLLYLKEGIEGIVDEEATRFHRNLQQARRITNAGSQPCFSCTPRSMVKDFRRQMWHMRCTLCNAWLQEIVLHHINQTLPNLCPENTDPQLWPTNPYEVFKCYMPYGCKGNQSAKDGDSQSIFSLIKNCRHFAACKRIGRMDLIDELLRIRNSLFHSGNFLLDDIDLKLHIQTMVEFLKGMTSLSPAESDAVQEALKKIDELKTNKLDLSLNRELELRALQQQQIALEGDLKSLQHSVATTTAALQNNVASLTATTAATQVDVRTLEDKTTGLELRIQKLQGVQDLFNRFLKANDLEEDLAKLSSRIESLESITQTHTREIQAQKDKLETYRMEVQSQKRIEEHLSDLELASTKHEGQLSTLYQRQERSETAQKRKLGTHEGQLAELKLDRKKQKQKQKNTEAAIEAQQKKSEAHERQLADLKSAGEEQKRKQKGTEAAMEAQQKAFETKLESQERKVQHIEEQIRIHEVDHAPSDMTEADLAILQAALIKHYRGHSLRIPNPVVAEKLGLEEIYVCPGIKVLRETKNPRAGLKNVQNCETPTNTSMCKQIFCTEDYKNKQVYITSDAGMGKTLFCKYLVHLWCNVLSGTPLDSDIDQDFGPCNDSSNYQGRKALTEDNRRMMSNFKLLFYITLRESMKQYNIDEMIDSQILRFVKCRKMLKASDILQNEGCLVIIDGLDEWACPEDAEVPHFVNPGIPGRLGLNSSTVYLTTTRPWKFDVLKLDSSDVDKHIELVGLNEDSSKQLCLKITRLLCDNEMVERTSERLWAELEKKGLTHLQNVPVILTQLVCLWFDNQDLGQSQVQLYCSMVEMLLKRPDKPSKDKTCTAIPQTEATETLLPACFTNRPYCQAHQQLLLILCRLAFEALFDQKRENALVFDSSQMKIFGEDEERIDLCLKSGILSQTKVLGKWSVSEKKLSFLHKTLQEFLAAIFMVNSENSEIVQSHIEKFCTSADTVLEMSQVWMFVSGIRPHMYEKLLTELLSHVVFIDRRVQQDRRTLYSSALHRPIQTCVVGCVEEAENNGHCDLRLPLHDFVIDRRTISACLESLLTSNISAVKSLYIDTDGMTVQTVERTVQQVKRARCLQKLYLRDNGDCVSSDVKKTLSKTLTDNKRIMACLELESSSLTTELFAAMCDAVKHVEALRLWRVRQTHEQIDQLLLSLSRTDAIRELRLSLPCTDHGNQCRPRIDVSGYPQLHTLTLCDMYIDELAAVANCVERVDLACVTIPERQLRQFLRQLSSASRRLAVMLWHVTVTGDSESPVDLTDLRPSSDKWGVTMWEYNDRNKTWTIIFHTRQQTTPGADSQT